MLHLGAISRDPWLKDGGHCQLPGQIWGLLQAFRLQAVNQLDRETSLGEKIDVFLLGSFTVPGKWPKLDNYLLKI